MKFYKIDENGVSQPSLISNTSGELWLKDTLSIGDYDGYVGLSGTGTYLAEIIFNEYDNLTTYSINDVVYYTPTATRYQCILTTTSNIPTNITYWQVYTGPLYADPIRLWAGDSNPNFAPFKATHSGSLFASNAQISGTIIASQGYIGNWVINNSEASYGALTSFSGLTGVGTSRTAFWSGGVPLPFTYSAAASYTPGMMVSYLGQRYRNILASINQLPTDTTYWEEDNTGLALFYVTDTGALFAQEAEITGTIHATSGEFSGSIFCRCWHCWRMEY